MKFAEVFLFFLYLRMKVIKGFIIWFALYQVATTETCWCYLVEDLAMFILLGVKVLTIKIVKQKFNIIFIPKKTYTTAAVKNLKKSISDTKPI